MDKCTAQCKMLLFCVKTIVHTIWTSYPVWRRRRRKAFWPSGDFLVWYFRNAFLVPLGVFIL